MNEKVKTPWYKFYGDVKKHMTYPDISLYEMLKQSTNKFSNNICYEYYGLKVTYKDFMNQINECSKAFKALDVCYGDIVSICMPNTPEAIISFYALNKIGAVANMIHPLSSENEIKECLNTTNSKYIICIDAVYNKVQAILNDTKVKLSIVTSAKDSMKGLLKLGYNLTLGRKIKVDYNKNIINWNVFIKLGNDYKDNIKDDYKGSCLAAILYSGGTTGYPKGIKLTNYNFNSMAIYGVEMCHCFDEKDKTLAILPIFHGFGLGLCIHGAFSIGASAVLIPKFRSKEFGNLIKKYKPSVIIGVPTLFESLLENKELNNMDLSFLRCMLCGGDSLSSSLKAKIDNFLKEHNASVEIREGYGLTECVAGSCITPINKYKEGSIGIPCPDVYYKIVKPNTNKELEYGNVGEILIAGPCVMQGYYNNEKETKLALRTHDDGLTWLYTGDLGYMDNNGFVYYKQRLKRMIISSGYNVYPQYVENVIDAHPDVLMSCVIGIPHPYKIQVAKAFIMLKDNITDEDKTLESIKEHCKKNLAKYSLPYEYEFVDNLPMTMIGKIDYKKLEDKELSKRSIK